MKNRDTQHLVLFDANPSSLIVLEKMFQKTMYCYHSAGNRDELYRYHNSFAIDLVLVHLSANYIEEIHSLGPMITKDSCIILIGIVPKSYELDTEYLTSNSHFEEIIETNLDEKTILSLVDQYLKYDPKLWTSSIDEVHQSYWYKKLITAYRH